MFVLLQAWIARIRAWKRQHRSILVGAIVIAIIGLALLGLAALPRRAATFRAIDVGQGDALLLQTRHGQVIVVDGGNSPEYLARLQRQLGVFHRRIDLLVLTHPHDDHLNGLIGVLKRFNVEKVLWTGVLFEGPGYEQFRELLARLRPDQVQFAQAGQQLQIDGGMIRVLWPPKSLLGTLPAPEREGGNGGLNDTSIVVEIEIDGVRVLLMGDVSSFVEKQIAADRPLQPIDILKIGHHGSRYSTSQKFIERVKPKIGIISVGAVNDYNHPAQSVMARLERAGARVLRTDRDGSISVDLIAGALKVQTDR